MSRSHVWLLVLSLLLLSRISLAQTALSGVGGGSTTTLTEGEFGIGLAMNLGTGSGLSLRHHLPGPLAFQFSGYGWKSGELLEYDFGAEVQFDLIVRRTNRFFVFIGGGYFYSGTPARSTLRGPTRLASGLGYEERLSKRVGISINVTGTSYQPVGDFDIYPFAAIHYYLH